MRLFASQAVIGLGPSSEYSTLSRSSSQYCIEYLLSFSFRDSLQLSLASQTTEVVRYSIAMSLGVSEVLARANLPKTPLRTMRHGSK